MSKRRHNFGTKRFKEKSLFIFHARIALKSLILLFVRLIARGARIGKTHTHTHTHTQTDRQTDRTSTVTLAHARRGLIIGEGYDVPVVKVKIELVYGEMLHNTIGIHELQTSILIRKQTQLESCHQTIDNYSIVMIVLNY